MSQSTDDQTRSELRAIRGHTAAVALHVEFAVARSSRLHVITRERDRAGSARLR
jgi:hypothetical protein